MSGATVRQMVLVIFLGIAFVAGLILSSQWLAIIQLICSLIVVGALLYMIWQRFQLKSHDILLDLGRIERKLGAWGGAAALLIGILNLAVYLTEQPADLRQLATFAFFTSGGCFLLATALSNIFITSTGISRFSGFIPWETILNYEWVGEQQQTLLLALKTRARLSWVIPAEQVAAMQSLLQAHAAQTPLNPHH